MANIFCSQMDEDYWTDPEAFLPERWLDETDGRFVYQSKGFTSFGMGKRNCIGESFAKMQIMLLVAMMVQRYSLEATPGYRVSLEMAENMAIKPVDQKPLIARRR